MKIICLCSLLGIVASFYGETIAQNIAQNEIIISKNQETLGFFLNEITEKTGYTFSYINSDIPLEKTILISNKLKTVKEILDALFINLAIQYEIRNDKIILMKRKKLSGHTYTIAGYITDNETGESLIGATIYNLQTEQGTTSNSYGFFSLTQPSDSIYLNVSFVGYEARVYKILLSKDTTIQIRLSSGTTLNEVVITGKDEDKIQESSRMSTIDIPVEQIKAVPAFLGEVDVFKVLQLLPGVQAGSEGSSGLYIRGGGPEQNLILLDGVPVYNASHLFGFFSVFNADAINRVELLKGGFPARYGGRLSSVIDINMKEGNDKKIKGEGSVGVVASRLTVEGPVAKNTTFIISGRRTYIDLLASPIIRNRTNGDRSGGYYFYDLNAKINHRINANNRIFLSVYSGQDKGYAQARNANDGGSLISVNEDRGGMGWGNITTALRWNSMITSKLFSNVTTTYSKYRFAMYSDFKKSETYNDSTTTNFSSNQYRSGIRDYAIKIDFDYLPHPNHYVRFGAQAIQHRFSPGVLSYRSTEEKRDTTMGQQTTNAKEFFAYMEDDFLITHRLKINAGVHVSGFLVENKFYKSLQPRISGRYLITPDLSWKASYSQMTQFIHLVSNVGIGLPTDLWVPATAKVGPEHSNLTATGAAYNMHNKYEFSLEGYYKKMEGVVDYKDGADYLNVESDWQTKVEIGEGQSYGAEFFAQKKTGKLSGWVGYTLSWTNRKFANINGGKAFPYRYDRRHDIKTAVVYKLKENREFSLTWVYGTGAAVTLQQSTYLGAEGQSINYYGNRNSYRMRAYHRLDISYTTTKKTKWGERSWSIGFYNLYNRKNPFYMDIGHDKQGHKKFIQVSLFPIIPSISYRFKF